jgi:hypothetical protein
VAYVVLARVSVVTVASRVSSREQNQRPNNPGDMLRDVALEQGVPRV